VTYEFSASLVTALEIQMMLRGFIPAVIIVIIGIIIGRWDASRHHLTLKKLTNYIFLPCLAFSAIHKHAFDPAEIFHIALAVCVIISVMSLVSVVVLREKFRGGSRNILAAVYMSSGTLLPPLAFVLFGNEGLAKAIYFHFFVIFAYHTVGLRMVEGRADVKGFFKTPFIYLIILGIAARLFPFSLPEIVEEFAWLSEKGIDLTAMGGLPLLLISFGYPLGLLRLSDVRGGLRGGLLRIIAGPLVALLVVYIYRKTGLISMERGYDVLGYLDQRTTEAVLVLGSAMPTSNYAMQLAGDKVTAGKTETGTLLVSTLAAGISIPVVLLLILMFIFTD
jgi:predicted permease